MEWLQRIIYLSVYFKIYSRESYSCCLNQQTSEFLEVRVTFGICLNCLVSFSMHSTSTLWIFARHPTSVQTRSTVSSFFFVPFPFHSLLPWIHILVEQVEWKLETNEKTDTKKILEQNTKIQFSVHLRYKCMSEYSHSSVFKSCLLVWKEKFMDIVWNFLLVI